MLSVEDALARVLALVHELPAVDVGLLDADGLTLARDVYAPFDIPSLANSASEAAPVTLTVVGQVQAGALADVGVPAGGAVRIMTGAPVPEGADAIVPFELTDEVARRAAGEDLSSIAVHHVPRPGEHIRPAGEDVATGDLVMRKGRVLDPPAIGLLASIGYAQAPVIRRPRVAVLATGDEVQDPSEVREAGRLYDSNSYGAAAALRRWGAEPVMLGIARDNMTELRAKLREGLDADLLVTSAGVSAGAFDMVKEVLAELGQARPLAFGLLDAPDGRKVPLLGLPGNPVSALVALVEFARPAIAKMRGVEPRPLPTVRAVLDEPIHNADGRRVYARVKIERRVDGLHARLTGAQGSNLLTSMELAQGLAICPEDVAERAAGESVVVQLFDWADHAALLTDELDLNT